MTSVNFRKKCKNGNIIATTKRLITTILGDKNSVAGNLTCLEEARIKKSITPIKDRAMFDIIPVGLIAHGRANRAALNT